MKKQLVPAKLVPATIIGGLLVSNLVTGISYKKDMDRLAQELSNKDETITYLNIDYSEQASVLEKQQGQIDQLNATVKEKADKIHSLEVKLNESKAKVDTKKPVEKPKEQAKRTLTMTATAYTATCKGCSGRTYTGYDVRNTIYYQGYRVIAADFNKIPLYSIVEIKTKTETFKAIVLDTGGAIRGSNTIDLLIDTYDKAIQFGRQEVKITVHREGKGGK